MFEPKDFLRLICGLFLFPHLFHKYKHFHDDGLRSMYAKAGLKPAVFFVALNMAIEGICGLMLVFGVQVRWAALIVAALMAIAARSVPQYNGKGWVWAWANSGIEYCVFWGLTAIAVAWMYW